MKPQSTTPTNKEILSPAPISREVEGFELDKSGQFSNRTTVKEKGKRVIVIEHYLDDLKERERIEGYILQAPTLYRENQQQAKDIEELKNGLMIAQNYIENFIAKGGIGEAEKDLLLVTELINRLK